MNKKIKRTLAVLTVALHVLTFSGPLHAIDIPEGTKVTVDTLEDGADIRVIGADGNVNAAGRGILEVMNQVVITQGLNVIGIVALLAQMGIHIESTAQINVQGGLILSTLGINEAAFLAGLNEIAAARQSDPAMILNEGRITLDANSFLVMLASAIKNVGDIAANGGTVVMAAGDKAVLSLGGDGLVNVEVTEPITAEVTDFNGNKVSDVISNSGKISANGGFVKLTAKGSEELFDSIINHTGVIEAQTVGEKDGKIVLDGGSEGVVRVNGTLDASGRDAGEKGGKVHVLGDKIGLFENAKIDVSGDKGGGEVLVGGDYQGKGDVRNARFVYMDQGAQIWADALTSGNGGKVILWANEATRAYGSISAKGGALSGNGGFVETSGKEYLDVEGINVNASAPNGAAGKWLLDPRNVTIVAGGAGTVPGGVFTPVADNSTIGATTINNTLNGGTNVEINTGTTGTQTGSITVSAAISKTLGTAATFTLKAAGAISIGATISAAVGRVLNLVLQSGGNITQTAALTITGTTTITAGANNVTLNNSGNDFTGAVSIVSGNNVSLRDANAIDLGASTVSGTLGVTAANGINITQNVTTGGLTTMNADVDNNGSGTFAVTNTRTLSSGNQALQITAADLNLNASGKLNSGTAATTIVASNGRTTKLGSGAAGDMTISGSELQNITAANLIVGSNTSGDITVDGITAANSDYVGTVTLNATRAAGQVIFSDASSLGVSSNFHGLTVNAGNGITLKADVNTSTSGVTMNADSDGSGAGTLTVGDSGSTDILASNGHDISLTAANIAFDTNGAIDAGAGKLSLATSQSGMTIGLGGGTGTFNISDSEADHMTASQIEIGATNAGNIRVDNFSPAHTSALVLKTGGNIAEGTADAGADITVTNLTLQTGTGVNVDTAVTNLTASASGTGAINVSNTGGMTVTSATTNNGNITLNATGGNLALTTVTASTGGGTGNVTASTTTSGNINVGSVTAAGDTVTLTSAGSITDSNAAANNITATFLNANAATGIDLDTNVTNITASNTGAGHINIDEANGANVLNVNAANGNATVTSTTGDLNITKLSSTGTTTATATAGAIRGVTDDGVADVSGATVNLTAGAGGIHGAAAGQALDVKATTALNADTSADNGNINLNAIGDALVGLVTTGSLNLGTVVLSATGDIVDTNGASTNIKAGNITLKAGDGVVPPPANDIGSSGDYFDIGTNNAWDASVPSGGKIYVACSEGNCPLGTIDVGTGHFGYQTTGAILDGNDTVNGPVQAGSVMNIIAGSTTLEAGTGIGATDNWVEMQLADATGPGTDGKIEANGGAGGVYFSNVGTTGYGLTVGGIGDLLNGIQATGGISVYSGSPLNVTSDIVDSGAGTINLTTAVSAGNDDITLAANVSTVGGKMGVFSGDAINQTGGAITADEVEFNANGFVTLDSANNDMNTIAGTSKGIMTLRDTDKLIVGRVDADGDGTFQTGLTSNDNLIDISTGGNLRLERKVDAGSGNLAMDANGNINQTGGAITADEVEFNANGFVTLDRANNDMNTIAGTSKGIMTLRDTDKLTVGRVDADGDGTFQTGLTSNDNLIDILTGGNLRLERKVDAGSDNLAMDANGNINQTGGAITADEVEFNANGFVTLDRASNDMNTIAGTSNGSMTIYDTDDLTIAAGVDADGDATSQTGLTEASGGDITVKVLGAAANDDLNVNADVTSVAGAGNILMVAGDTMTLAAGVTVSTATTGNVTLDAGEDATTVATNDGSVTGDVVMTSGSTISTEDGAVNIEATRDVYLAEVKADSDGSNPAPAKDGESDITVTAVKGEIIDNNAGTTNLYGDHLVMTADTGIGSGDAIETEVNNLEATNNVSGNIKIDEAAAGGDLGLWKILQSGAGDVIIRTLGGVLTVVAGQSGVSAKNGETTLQSMTSDVVVNDTVDSTTGKINIDAANDVIFSKDGDVTATGGAEIEVNANRHITMADGTILQANGGDALTGGIDLDALNGDITLGSVQTTSTLDNAVTIFAKNGAIIDGGDTDKDIVTGASTAGVPGTGGGMLLRAKTGIGSRGTGVGVVPDAAANNFATDALDTQGGRLAAQTETGDIQIQNVGGLEVVTLSDNDGASSFTTPGAGTVTGVLNNDSTHVDPNSIIFITSASPMTVSSAVTNLDGGNISLYALGTTPLVDTMTLNADVRTQGGNGDIRIVSGSNMDMAGGVTVSTAGDTITSGTGNVIMGAGYDATGKAANEPAATLVGPGAAPGDIGANLTMAPTSIVATEDGNILVDAQNDFTVGLLHADGGSGKGDITDGIRGDVTTFSRNGSTLDVDAPGATPQLNNIYAQTWNGTAGIDIGSLLSNPIETNVPVQNLIAGRSIDVDNTGNVLLNADAATGSIQFRNSGDILLGHAFAANGQNVLYAGLSIFSQGGSDVRVIGDEVIKLIANGGVIGTASDHIQTQLNHAGSLFLQAGSQQGLLSANIRGNFTRANVQFLNTPPGLVSFNGVVIGGQPLQGFEAGMSGLYYNPNPVSLPAYGFFDGRYSADFPAFFDQNRFAFAPVTGINTAGIDVLPIEGLGILPPVVPIPTPAIPPVPVPEAGQPPLTVPLPGLAKLPVPQPNPEQTTLPVYVARGRGTQAGLAESEEKKKKDQGTTPAGTPLVVPVPVSAVPPVQEPGVENTNPPFPVSLIAPAARAAGEQARQGQSPLGQNEAANAGAGSTSTPVVGGSETAAR